jgi:hypothetical protein
VSPARCLRELPGQGFRAYGSSRNAADEDAAGLAAISQGRSRSRAKAARRQYLVPARTACRRPGIASAPVARARQLPRDLEAGAVVRAYHEVHSRRIRGTAAIRPLAERRPWITGPSSHDGTSRFAQMRMSAADLRPSDSISTCERYLNRYRGIPRTDRDIDARRNSTSPRTRRTARPSPGRPPQHRRGCLVPAVAGMGPVRIGSDLDSRRTP